MRSQSRRWPRVSLAATCSSRTGQLRFTRRDAHHAAPRGRFPKATDLDPALSLLEEHEFLRRVDADRSGPKGGRPPSPRFLVNPLPRATEPTQPTDPIPRDTAPGGCPSRPTRNRTGPPEVVGAMTR
jgi:hypothetical protein